MGCSPLAISTVLVTVFGVLLAEIAAWALHLPAVAEIPLVFLAGFFFALVGLALSLIVLSGISQLAQQTEREGRNARRGES